MLDKDIQNAFVAFMQSQDNSRSGVAALALLVWDALINIEDEVEFIWLSRWTPLKFVFFFTRYYSIIILTILNARSLTCKQWITVEAISAVLLELAVEGLLILRIFAMYPDKTRLKSVILGFLVVQMTLMAATLGICLPRVMTSKHCISTEIPLEMVAYCIASIVYEAFLFVLAAMKLRSAMAAGHERTNLMKVLLRDNMWTFLIVSAVMVGNTILFTIAPATLAVLGFPWVLAILGVLGPRLMLNVRREHHRRSFTSFTSNISSLVFMHYSPVPNPGALPSDHI